MRESTQRAGQEFRRTSSVVEAQAVSPSSLLPPPAVAVFWSSSSPQSLKTCSRGACGVCQRLLVVSPKRGGLPCAGGRFAGVGRRWRMMPAGCVLLRFSSAGSGRGGCCDDAGCCGCVGPAGGGVTMPLSVTSGPKETDLRFRPRRSGAPAMPQPATPAPSCGVCACCFCGARRAGGDGCCGAAAPRGRRLWGAGGAAAGGKAASTQLSQSSSKAEAGGGGGGRSGSPPPCCCGGSATVPPAAASVHPPVTEGGAGCAPTPLPLPKPPPRAVEGGRVAEGAEAERRRSSLGCCEREMSRHCMSSPSSTMMVGADASLAGGGWTCASLAWSAGSVGGRRGWTPPCAEESFETSGPSRSSLRTSSSSSPGWAASVLPSASEGMGCCCGGRGGGSAAAVESGGTTTLRGSAPAGYRAKSCFSRT